MRFLPAVALLVLIPAAHLKAQETPTPTQTLLRASREKDAGKPTASTLILKLDDKVTPVTSLNPVTPNGTQVALLIDDGLARSVAVQLNDLRAFANALPPGTELLIGYMTNGTVRIVQPFTSDHAAAAEALRIPFGTPGQSASPYFCLSEFVKHWPGEGADRNQDVDTPNTVAPPTRARKARFVMMITNGVDPYNGSVSPLNQDSPYVQTALDDANRAGVAVSSIYYRDSGFSGGGAASFSGQSYLEQVSAGTGGEAYYQGNGSPVSLAPFLSQFTHAISETYVATFNATADRKDHLLRLKVDSTIPKLKLRHPAEVRAGNVESTL